MSKNKKKFDRVWERHGAAVGAVVLLLAVGGLSTFVLLEWINHPR